MIFNYFIIIFVFTLNLTLIYGKPKQIHLSLGAHPTEMMVTFTTTSKTTTSSVRYNKVNGAVKTVNSEQFKFDDGKNYKVHIHRALLTGLEPGQHYEYQCETDGTWSDLFKFKAAPNDTNGPVRLAIYGDLGLENGVSIPQLEKDVANQMYDSIFHIGDIAYNLNKDDGTVGDKFMELIEPIAANVAYQTCPGNHEDKRNFTHYLNRFTMVDQKSGHINNHYYSLNMGPAHFIFFSTELYFWPEYFDETHVKWQYQWLENDLIEATKPENRNLRPWIITLGHRPMYCLTDDDDCFHQESVLRTGRSGTTLTKTSDYGLENMFHKYGVDIQFYGHKHLYSRSYPIFNFETTKTGNFYENPKTPIHIISGAAGTADRPNEIDALPDWVAFLYRDWGFTRMTVQNRTHITFEQFSTEHNKIVDSFVVKKDR